MPSSHFDTYPWWDKVRRSLHKIELPHTAKLLALPGRRLAFTTPLGGHYGFHGHLRA